MLDSKGAEQSLPYPKYKSIKGKIIKGSVLGRGGGGGVPVPQGPSG